jgi:hypothetical protein
MASIISLDDWLTQLAATDPAAQKIIDEIRARRKRRGRPAISDRQYRKLELWWKRFRRLNSHLTEERAAGRFFSLRGDAIAKELGLKRTDFTSLRNAVRRGAKESARIKSQRMAEWQIVPTGLAEKILKGADHRIATDRNEAILIRAAQRAALLGK